MAVFNDMETIDSIAKHIEGGGRSADLKIRIAGHSQGGKPQQHPDLDEILRKRKDFKVCIFR
jgi:hypothetical protein